MISPMKEKKRVILQEGDKTDMNKQPPYFFPNDTYAFLKEVICKNSTSKQGKLGS